MPKSSSLTVPSGGDEDVLRLDVAVDDEVAMRVRDAGADLLEERNAFAHREPAVGAVPIDGHAVHVLHHEVEQVVGGRARIQQSRDVGMLEPREQLPLAQEPISQGQERRRQNLHRHPLGKRAVVALGKIDGAGTAGAEEPHQAIRPDEAPGQLRCVRKMGKGGQELPWTLVRFQERSHLGRGGGVPLPQVRQKRVTTVPRTVDGLLEEIGDFRPRHGRHRVDPSRLLTVRPNPAGATAVH